MSEFDPFDRGSALRAGSVVMSTLTTKPGVRVVGIDLITDTMLAITFEVDESRGGGDRE